MDGIEVIDKGDICCEILPMYSVQFCHSKSFTKTLIDWQSGKMYRWDSQTKCWEDERGSQRRHKSFIDKTGKKGSKP